MNEPHKKSWKYCSILFSEIILFLKIKFSNKYGNFWSVGHNIMPK
jgi:hypothetical protein